MRSTVCPLCLGLLLVGGCSSDRAPSVGSASPAVPTLTNTPGSDGLIVTPDISTTGKVAFANQSLRFVVVNFPVGRMPVVDQRLNVYRRGLKVGEIKVNARQLDDNIVADVVLGEAEAGDEVRSR